jgi:hypothetical protein
MGNIEIILITGKSYKKTYEETILNGNYYKIDILPKRKKERSQVLLGGLLRPVSGVFLEEDTFSLLCLVPLSP